MCDAALQARVAVERVWLAEPTAVEGPGPGCALLGEYPTAALAEAFERSTPVGAGLLRAGASLWRKYAGSSPRLFDLARRRGNRFFP
ncbi:MAG TPA: hypothetical protein VML55_02620, partial [Planctomycetaceae bacterium]|nr:hypothetical protein [Planctomycetaceae bacterium]